MQTKPTRATESSARALAMLVAADGRIDDSELCTLDRLDAFRRIGVSRTRFLELARACAAEIGARWNDQLWLHALDMRYVDGILDEVDDPNQRLLVCRFAAAAIAADGRVSRDERLVYDHTLAHWHISQMMVSHAILHDRLH